LLEHIAGILFVREQCENVAKQLLLVPGEQPDQQFGAFRLHSCSPRGTRWTVGSRQRNRNLHSQHDRVVLLPVRIRPSYLATGPRPTHAWPPPLLPSQAGKVPAREKGTR